jgi:hypothetical protein
MAITFSNVRRSRSPLGLSSWPLQRRWTFLCFSYARSWLYQGFQWVVSRISRCLWQSNIGGVFFDCRKSIAHGLRWNLPGTSKCPFMDAGLSVIGVWCRVMVFRPFDQSVSARKCLDPWPLQGCCHGYGLLPGLDFLWNVVTQWKIRGANVFDKSFDFPSETEHCFPIR